MKIQLELIKTDFEEIKRIKSLIGKFPFHNISYIQKGNFCLEISFDNKYLKDFFNLGVALGRINQKIEDSTNLIDGNNIFFSDKTLDNGK